MSKEVYTTFIESTVITAIARLYAMCFTLIAMNHIILIYESSTRYTTVSCQLDHPKNNIHNDTLSAKLKVTKE